MPQHFSISSFLHRLFFPKRLIQKRYRHFKALLEQDALSHTALARLEGLYHAEEKMDFYAVKGAYEELSVALLAMIENLQAMAPHAYSSLLDAFHNIDRMARPFLAIELEEDASWPLSIVLDEIPPASEGLVGGKAAQLSRIRKELELPTPSGFAVTTRAFHLFCDHNALKPQIEAQLAPLDISSSDALDRTSKYLMRLIEASPLPPELESAIGEAYELCFPEGDVRVSVRSSAVGEDASLSFAGQYKTVLDVQQDRLGGAYKAVIASKYSPSALAYRVSHGLLDMEAPMAVLITQMVDAQRSGIVYTQDPVSQQTDVLTVYVIQGLGELLVSGAVTPEVIRVARDADLSFLEIDRAPRQAEMLIASDRGLQKVGVHVDRSDQPFLAPDTIRRLAAWGLRLEAHFGGPQDVEWALDGQGNLFLLQSRPLRLGNQSAPVCPFDPDSMAHKVLLSGGERASTGVAVGRVFVAASLKDLTQIPRDAVLVAPTTSPRFASLVDRLRAVVTDVGSAAGHFASVAREWGIPTLVNTQKATQVLRTGQTVTVDAVRGKVFDGLVQALLDPSCTGKASSRSTPFQERLRRILDHVSPLNLVNVEGPDFRAEHCKTFHDILRFAHEMGVREMFALGSTHLKRLRGAKKLVSDVPISLYVLDLGGGLTRETALRRRIRIEDLVNPALRSLWKGLAHPDNAWETRPVSLNWDELDRVSLGEGIINIQSRLLASFALISEDYLNINIRFGYHFIVLDALCVDNVRENYISLRFEGGGAAFEGRKLRALFLAQVLESYGFEVQIDGDKIAARLSKASSAVMEEKLERVGRLLGFTPLLDMRLKAVDEVTGLVKQFEEHVERSGNDDG